ncbi:MAG: YraN family protein [Anaerolineales bacterium]
MVRQKQTFGSWGEQTAAGYLEKLGYEILGHNVRTQYGEIDLIARHASTMVFVEVKTRSSSEYGYPEESITPAKQQHMLDAAQDYLQAHPELDGEWRVDVVSIRRLTNQHSEITHIENAIEL